ncbi:MAG: ABC transporter permease, partial [Cetobacterium sp.]
PLIYPSFVVGISLTIIVSLAQYLITFIIGGGQVVTLPILLMPYLNEGASIGSVYSIIYIIFTYLLVILLNKITKIIFRKREIK